MPSSRPRASLTRDVKRGPALWLGDRLVARVVGSVEDSRVTPEEPEPRWLRDAMVFVDAVNRPLDAMGIAAAALRSPDTGLDVGRLARVMARARERNHSPEDAEEHAPSYRAEADAIAREYAAQSEVTPRPDSAQTDWGETRRAR